MKRKEEVGSVHGHLGGVISDMGEPYWTYPRSGNEVSALYNTTINLYLYIII